MADHFYGSLEANFWETHTVVLKVNENHPTMEESLPDLDKKMTEHAVHGWEPFAFIKGGSTWIVSFKRRRPIAGRPSDEVSSGGG